MNTRAEHHVLHTWCRFAEKPFSRSPRPFARADCEQHTRICDTSDKRPFDGSACILGRKWGTQAVAKFRKLMRIGRKRWRRQAPDRPASEADQYSQGIPSGDPVPSKLSQRRADAERRASPEVVTSARGALATRHVQIAQRATTGASTPCIAPCPRAPGSPCWPPPAPPARAKPRLGSRHAGDVPAEASPCAERTMGPHCCPLLPRASKNQSHPRLSRLEAEDGGH